MAPKAAVKRPAGHAAAAPPAKAARVELKARQAEASPAKRKAKAVPQPAKKFGVPTEAYTGVVEGLSLASHLSDSCREMLLAVVPTSVCVPVDLRTGPQAMAVKMIEETLGEVAKKLEAGILEALAVVEGVAKTTEEAEAKVMAAGAVVTNAQEAISAKQAALEEATKALADSKKTLAEKHKEQKANATALSHATAELSKVEGILTNDFGALKEGRWEKPAELKKHTNSVEGFLKKLHVEASMLAALPGVLGKKPEQRGSFDGTLLTECENRLQGHVDALKKQVDTLKEEEPSMAAILEAASAAVEANEKAQAEAAAALQGAQAGGEEAAKMLSAAQDELKEVGPTAKRAAAAVTEQQGQLEVFKSFSLGSFYQLRDRKSKAEEEAAPAIGEIAVEAQEAKGEAAAAPMEAEEAAVPMEEAETEAAPEA